ncbi:hypothetical protein J3R83DRAFT_3263 [Lanmaoa asiatica]|nr:hypothetical protein J3R83DRAFT_3263 [Lanmaoa asiatica]
MIHLLVPSFPRETPMVFLFTIPFVTSRKSGAHSYDPVPAPDEETLLASPENKETRILTSSKRTLFFDSSFWLTAFAALSIAFTIRNLLVIQLHSQEPHVSYLDAPIGSPYNGLEKLVRNESSPSWPLSSIHYPDFIGATEGSYIHRALSNGSVVRLDSERTIIIQQRIRDYGLEQCAVKVEFSRKAGNGHGHTARGYGHIGESPYLTLWHLEDSESKAVLASSALPTSLPSRKQFLGNIALDDMRPAQSSLLRVQRGIYSDPGDRCCLRIRSLHHGVPTHAVAATTRYSILVFVNVGMVSKNFIAGFLVVQSEQKDALV